MAQAAESEKAPSKTTPKWERERKERERTLFTFSSGTRDATCACVRACRSLPLVCAIFCSFMERDLRLRARSRCSFRRPLLFGSVKGGGILLVSILFTFRRSEKRGRVARFASGGTQVSAPPKTDAVFLCLCRQHFSCFLLGGGLTRARIVPAGGMKRQARPSRVYQARWKRRCRERSPRRCRSEERAVGDLQREQSHKRRKQSLRCVAKATKKKSHDSVGPVYIASTRFSRAVNHVFLLSNLVTLNRYTVQVIKAKGDC